MNEFSRIRKPVKREGAERYLLLTLLSFAGSVILTRLFLAVTGYPQLSGGPLHVAHVLWGGLLLFIASLLPLVLSNRWVYLVGAFLAGVGVGLFIDEVGKFITQNNDYFYPAAAPIIYAFFLLTVLVYAQVRRPPSRDPRAELYRALDGLSEVLDHDLDAEERTGLEERLRLVASQAPEPHLARLARALLDFLNSGAVPVAPPTLSFWERWLERVLALEMRWVTRFRLKLALIIGLVLLGLGTLVDLVAFLAISIHLGGMARVLDTLIRTGQVASPASLSWFLARTGLEALVGLLILIGVRLLLSGKEQRGLTLAYYGLLLALTTVNLLVFYFDQFGALLGTLYQLGLLLALIWYRRRYLSPVLAGRVGLEEMQVLREQYAEAESANVRSRVHAVLLSAEGHSLPEIAELTFFDQDTIIRWLNEYQAGRGTT